MWKTMRQKLIKKVLIVTYLSMVTQPMQPVAEVGTLLLENHNLPVTRKLTIGGTTLIRSHNENARLDNTIDGKVIVNKEPDSKPVTTTIISDNVKPRSMIQFKQNVANFLNNIDKALSLIEGGRTQLDSKKYINASDKFTAAATAMTAAIDNATTAAAAAVAAAHNASNDDTDEASDASFERATAASDASQAANSARNMLLDAARSARIAARNAASSPAGADMAAEAADNARATANAADARIKRAQCYLDSYHPFERHTTITNKGGQFVVSSENLIVKGNSTASATA